VYLSNSICYTARMMGGRGRVRIEKNRLEQRFGARGAAARVTPRYNAAPAQSLPVILNTAPHTIQFLQWDLRPSWSTKRTTRAGIIHVRADTLRARPTFQRDLAERRCLVLADSFYVWKKEGTRKIPYRVVLTSGEPFAFAGMRRILMTTGSPCRRSRSSPRRPMPSSAKCKTACR
jgi:putative SOS response-associated peptidase YedK